MSIAIRSTKASRIRAFAAANPGVAESEIARRLAIRSDEVRAVLGRKDQRRAKSVADSALHFRDPQFS